MTIAGGTTTGGAAIVTVSRNAIQRPVKSSSFTMRPQRETPPGAPLSAPRVSLSI
ncbi:MAG: hypothetical protein FWE83_03345 [Oscillospiraceae bacterium]|nr:hypothetical protein [Oscillospiraceae bacterium]